MGATSPLSLFFVPHPIIEKADTDASSNANKIPMIFFILLLLANRAGTPAILIVYKILPFHALFVNGSRRKFAYFAEIL